MLNLFVILLRSCTKVNIVGVFSRIIVKNLIVLLGHLLLVLGFRKLKENV